MLTGADGKIFVIVNYFIDEYFSYSTTIARYLPDGRLDSSYGNAGYSSAVFLRANCAVMLGDKIVVAGLDDIDFGDFELACYTSDGKLDSSFGKNGKITTDFNNTDDNANAIAIQEDKIVLAGYASDYSNSDFALARYTVDGKPDSSFGKNGKVVTNFNNSWNEANAITLEGNKIIVAGYTGEYGGYYDFALARYTANGQLDSSFGVNGKVTTDISIDDRASSVALQGKKIIVGGSAGPYSNNDFVLIRYHANGSLDTTFGKQGKVITDFGKNDEGYSLSVTADKIILAGYSIDYEYDSSSFAIARYTKNGALDTSFGVNGKVTTDFGGAGAVARTIALEGDKVLVGGYTWKVGYEYGADFALARYTADGMLDASFGERGKLIGYFPSPSGAAYFTSTAIQGNKILAAGYALNDLNNEFVLARYAAGGSLDSSFGVNGKVITDFNNSGDYAYSLALQGNKIVLAGYTGYYPNRDFALARYTANGKLDSTFGVNGKVVTDYNNSDDGANAIILQENKIIVAGYTFDFPNHDFALLRYTADGKLDSTFGVNGKTRTDFNNSSDEAYSIALQGDRIIAGGYAYDQNNGNYFRDFALARYRADGTLDSTFGRNGKVTTTFNSSYNYAQSIAIQGSKIVMAGESGGNFALTRYSAEGKLDTSFGKNGKVITDFGDNDLAYSIASQGDKIIVGGKGDWDFALARYHANGSLDSSFGKDGKVITDLEGSSFIQAIAVHQNRLYAVGSLEHSSTDTYAAVAAYQLETPAPSISIANVTVSESKRLAVVTVRLSAPTNKIVRVHFTTRDKTAVSKEDYTPVSGPLFFIPGVNTTAKIIIPIVDDSKQENNEQFEIFLSNVHNASIQDSVAVVTIIDNDAAPIAQQSTSLHIYVRPNPSTNAFTVQFQGSNLKQPISVRVYEVSGRLVEQRNNIFAGQSLQLGDQYKAGTYIIEAVQGSQSMQSKLVKLNR